MPTTLDRDSLDGVAALLSEAHDLYAAVLPHLHRQPVRDALCGVMAVRHAMALRLYDLMRDLALSPRPPTRCSDADVAALQVHRFIAQGDEAGALNALESWDLRLRSAVQNVAATPGLHAVAAANLNFIARILEAAPVVFRGERRQPEAAA
jgi:hypothetical protein